MVDPSSRRPSELPPFATLKDAAQSVWPERTLKRFRVHDDGWTNLVLEADEELIFRFPRWREVARVLDYEVRVLDLIARHLSSPVPQPIRIAVLSNPRGWPFISYRKIPGRPLNTIRRLDEAGKRKLRAFVRTLLNELASMPTRPLLRIGAPEGDPRAWAKKYRGLETRYHRRASSRIPAPTRRKLDRAFERFFADLQSARYRPIATHGDLGLDHLLWDVSTNRPTGVIDWEDFRLGDPAFDLTGFNCPETGGPREWTRARKSEADATFEERLAFYRAIRPLHGVLYAIEIRDRELFHAQLSKLSVTLQV
ncbi:MAG: aminoglycoside phosphotransferase family protein [Thermoplasmata archaeon]